MNKLILLLCFLPGLLLAQQGTISGTVVDDETAETMIALPVIVVGTDIVRTTDFDGKYSIQVPAGTYTIKFAYLGYQDKLVTDVIVKDGEVTFLDVKMVSASTGLEEIVVTAKSIERTENALLMLQRNSDKIQDGISYQEMSRMAVGNVATAMTKITGTSIQEGKYVVVRGLGDRYSLSQLNGLPMPSIDPYRNSAQLDLIPTKLLDNIIATKTFTPDQPGTFTGGNIDIRTKSFPERQTLSLSVSMGYNAQNNLREDFLSHEGGDGDKWGYGLQSRERPDILSDSLFAIYDDKNAELDARFGDSLAASTIDQAVNAMNLKFDTLHQKSLMDYGVSLSYGNSYRTGDKSSLGLILGASYRQEYENRPDALQASWFVYDDKAGDLRNSGNYRRSDSSVNPTVNGFGGLAYKFNDYNTIDFKLIYNHSASKSTTFLVGEDGENIIAPSYKLGRAQLWQERQMINYQVAGEHHLPKLGDLEIAWRGSIVNADRIEPNLRFFSSQYDAETGTEGIPLANVNDPYYFWRNLNDDIKVGAIDFTLPILKHKNDGSKIKVGGFLSNKERNFDEYRYIIATPQYATDYTGDIDAFFADDNTGLLRVDKLSGGRSRYVIGNYINEATRVENSYAGYEDVSAAYAMVTISPLRKLKLIAGARLESTDIFVQSKIVQIIGETPDSTNTGQIDVTNVLPSANLVYAIGESMNLRGSYNQTLARPNLREIAPFASFDPLIDEFFIGNPELVTTDIKNYDLRWEWFTQPGELYAVSVFYKTFKNPISLQYLNSSNPEFQYANVDEGTIGGIELELRKTLGFIAPAFDKFKISTNLTFITSTMDVIEQSGLEPESRPFEGQSPLLANLSLGYLNPDSKWDIQVSYNYTGERLAVVGLNSPDIYERGLSTLDAVISKKLGNVSLKFAANNLLNPNYTTSSEYLGQEYLTRQYKKGTSFVLSVAYEL
ncbi:MAG: TonB-dependent receptor [Saprospiraceae bacterium]|nr:TonB-dependent receptor [Candidatus Opimibacter skivensis]